MPDTATAFSAKKKWGKLAAAFSSVNKAKMVISVFTPKQPINEEQEYDEFDKKPRAHKRGRSQSVLITEHGGESLQSRDHAIGLLRMSAALDEDIAVSSF